MPTLVKQYEHQWCGFYGNNPVQRAQCLPLEIL